MTIYLSILLALCLLNLGTIFAPNARNYAYWVALVFLFLFSAFRLEVGCDWTGYLNIFQLSDQTPWQILVLAFDPGFMLMNKLVVALGLPYTFVNVASSVVFFGGIHFLAKQQPNPLAFLTFTFPVMILNLPMSALRQGMAVGLICMAFVFFIRNQKVRYLILVILASSFHSSAIIFVVFIPLAGAEFTRKKLAIFFTLMVVVVVFLAMRPVGQQAIERYVDSTRQSNGAIFRILYLAIPCLFFLIFMRKAWKERSPQDYTLVVMGSLMFFLSAAVVAISTTVGDRLAYYFYPIQAIILARMPVFYSERQDGFIVGGFFALMFIFFIAWASMSDLFQLCYVPYDWGIHSTLKIDD